MLTHVEKNIILWTPFKNYSTSLNKALLRSNGWRQVIGADPALDGQASWHTHLVPKGSERRIKLLPVRDPFERVVSMYLFALKFVDLPRSQDGFDRWFDTHAIQPVCGPVTRQYEYDHVIPCDRIVDALAEHGIEIGELPHENASTTTWRPNLSARQRIVIEWWHRSDFEALREHDQEANS